jgi:hypothetical protein
MVLFPPARCAAALDAALASLLADPLVRAVMVADHLSETDSMTVLRGAARAVARRRAAGEFRRR